TLKVKWSSLKEGTGELYEGSKNDEKAMKDFIGRAARREEKGNMLKMEPQQIIDRTGAEDLWRSVVRFISEGRTHLGKSMVGAPAGCLSIGFSPEEIARIHFHPHFVSPKQVRAVETVLSRCDDRGEPDFYRIDVDRKPYYVPYSRETISSVKKHIGVLEELRSAYLERWEDDKEEGGKRTPKLKVEDISQVELPEELSAELDRICRWGVSYLENGFWPSEERELGYTDLGTSGPFGLAGTNIRRLHRFDLERFVAHFTMDATSTKKGDLASGLVTFLLLLGKIDWRDASELVVKFNMGSGGRRFHENFPLHVMKVAENLPENVEVNDEMGREDLTGLETYTIDPSDAKDFDDAVSIRKEEGRTMIWVHIADVSHYVRPGDLIDAEARFRSTSVYLPTRVIPMLPPRLSEDLCSLREGVKRLALSTLMVFDEDLELLQWRHFPSVIMVRANLDYEQVNGWIDEGREPFISLHHAAAALEKKGSRLKIETRERRVRFMNGSNIEIELKSPTKATKMIEELMVAANECAARFLEDRGIPTLFRVHPLPDRTSASKFNAACEALGLDIMIDPDWEADARKPEEGPGDPMLNALLSGGKISFGVISDPIRQGSGEVRPRIGLPSREVMDRAVGSYNEALQEIGDLADDTIRELLNLRVLRTLGHAYYSVENIGHFGLGSMSYLHFTSPIRRYPDILAHRAVKSCLDEEGIGPAVGWSAPESGELEDQMEHTNDMADSAEDWERDMIDVALSTRARMTLDILKGTHSGTVISLTPASCFVLLDDGVTEGRIPLRDMSPYTMTVDENESKVIVDLTGDAAYDPRFRREISRGCNEAVFLKLGDRIGCRISSVSIASGRIDLQLAS
ncbi:MAG: VacB/RNase II family 3'-5' exoribonuclease, partial [Candidatus Thermoplasmatota archaeon]|nr:VacB/RNase II family 3'-5' exoribonuclease [Candidatus Thermoplasmatota archaeon]